MKYSLLFKASLKLQLCHSTFVLHDLTLIHWLSTGNIDGSSVRSAMHVYSGGYKANKLSVDHAHQRQERQDQSKLSKFLSELGKSCFTNARYQLDHYEGLECITQHTHLCSSIFVRTVLNVLHFQCIRKPAVSPRSRFPGRSPTAWASITTIPTLNPILTSPLNSDFQL